MRQDGSATSTGTAARPPLPVRVGFRATLTVAMGSGMFLVFALSVLAPFIIEDLGVGRAAIGGLTTVMFACAAAGSPIAGPLIDKLGGRRLVLTLFIVAAVSWSAVAAAPSYVWLLVGATGAGIAIAIMLPAITQLVTVHVPPGRRGVAMGIAQSGAPAAQLTAGAALPSVALVLGWRGALLACALLLPLAIVIALLTVPHGRAPGGTRTRAPAAGRPGDASTVRWLGVYAFLINFGVTATTIYLPLYAHEALGLPVTVAGLVAGFVAVLGVAGKLLWGRIGERALAPQRLMTVIALLTAVGVGLIASASGLGVWLLWIGILGFALNGMNWPVLIMLTVARETRVNVSARAAGRVMMAGYVGAAVGPMSFGALADLVGSYTPGWFGVVAAIVSSVLIAQVWHRLSLRRLASERAPSEPDELTATDAAGQGID